VDDETLICKLFNKMLTQIGYRVTTVTNPVEALVLFKSDPQYFDLVITDMTMPDMSGADLAEALIASRSDIPIIICTGHSDLMNEHKAKALGVSALIMKPIVFEELSLIIHQILTSSRSPAF
jgi:DNA-binding NtrC family response regulator